MLRLDRIAGSCLLLALSTAVFAAPREPRIDILIPSLQASDMFMWRIPAQIANPTEFGIFCDSLILTIENLDQGKTGGERPSLRPINLLSRTVSLSAGDSAGFAFEGVAPAEHARIHLRLHARDHSDRRLLAEATQEVLPGSTSRRFRSRFIEVNGRKIETVFVPSVRREAPSPGLLLVHGHGSHARVLLPRAWILANRGYSVMLVSQPGYGASEGNPDFMGPLSLAAAMAAFDKLKRSPEVDSTRLAAWGLSRGATVVASLASRRSDLKALVAESGIYDLWATWRDTSLPGFREMIVAEAGHDSAAWRERSPVTRHARIKASTLVMHGAHDSWVPVEQARGFLARLKKDGASAEGHFFPDTGHNLPPEETFRIAEEFLDRELAQ